MIKDDVWKKLKFKAVENDTTVSAMLRKMVDDVINKK